MKLRLSISVFLIILFGNALANLSALEQLSNLLQKTKTITASFSQTVEDQYGVIDETQGEIALQRPNKFYWYVKSPEQLIISNGKTLWNYQPLLKQVIVKSTQDIIGATPLVILSGSTAALKRDFNVTRETVKAGEQCFKLTVKQSVKDASFSTIYLTVKQGHIETMRLLDALGQATQLHFNNIKFNQTLPTSRFQFRIPENVDVVKS